jgi:hypothetical protein
MNQRKLSLLHLLATVVVLFALPVRFAGALPLSLPLEIDACGNETLLWTVAGPAGVEAFRTQTNNELFENNNNLFKNNNKYFDNNKYFENNNKYLENHNKYFEKNNNLFQNNNTPFENNKPIENNTLSKEIDKPQLDLSERSDEISEQSHIRALLLSQAQIIGLSDSASAYVTGVAQVRELHLLQKSIRTRPEIFVVYRMAVPQMRGETVYAFLTHENQDIKLYRGNISLTRLARDADTRSLRQPNGSTLTFEVAGNGSAQELDAAALTLLAAMPGSKITSRAGTIPSLAGTSIKEEYMPDGTSKWVGTQQTSRGLVQIRTASKGLMINTFASMRQILQRWRLILPEPVSLLRMKPYLWYDSDASRNTNVNDYLDNRELINRELEGVLAAAREAIRSSKAGSIEIDFLEETKHIVLGALKIWVNGAQLASRS